MKKILLLFVMLLCLEPLLWAAYHEIKIDRIDRRVGLYNSKIFSIAQDSLGFIWIATENGLERFDGNKFTLYKHDICDSTSIAGNSINDLLFDEKGYLWIATKYNGLDRYDPVMDTFIHYFPSDKEKSISGPAITDICMSSTGKMWVSTYYDGLNLMDREAGTFESWKSVGHPSDVIKENIILSVMEDSNKWLWIGYYSKGCSSINIETGEVKHFEYDPLDKESLPAGKIQKIIQDRMGNVWIGTENGLALYNRSDDSFINFYHDASDPESLVGNNVMTICEMDDGKIWIGTENGGISILDFSFPLLERKGISFKNIRKGDFMDNLSCDSVYDIFQDSYGNIWVGTYGMGINFISSLPASFNNLKYIPFSEDGNSLSNNTAWGICEAPDGKIWIGTDGGGINIYDRKQKKLEVIKASSSTIRDNAILCALTDSRGRMWFGTYIGGLACYDSETGKFRQFIHEENNPASIPSNDVRAIYEDSKGRIFVGTMDGLCLFRESTSDFQVFTKNDVLLVNNCRAIIEDNDGYYWIGHHGGITCLYPDMSLKDHFFYDYSLYTTGGGREKRKVCNDNIYSIYKDRIGRIWFGTNAGLSRWCPEKKGFKYYSIKEGLADNFVRAITEDESGLLWMSTNNSISCFDPEREVFINYTYNNGIPFGEFMDNSCLKGSDGLIYFGSCSGLYWFFPKLLIKNIELPDINFTDFDLFGETVTPMKKRPLKRNIAYSDKITLACNQNVFTFHYSLPDFSLANKVIYRYRMEGLDSRWIRGNNFNYAYYRNVPPGKYRFCVQASMNNIDWTGSEADIEVVVLQSIWLRWYMKMIYLFIAITLFYYCFKLMRFKLDLLIEQKHMQEVESLNQNKLQFFTNISHDIKTPLTLIMSPIQDLLKKDFSNEVKAKLNMVNNNANHLFKMFNRLLDFRKIENGYAELSLFKGNIIGVIMDVCVSYREFRYYKKVKFDYKTEINELNIWYDREKVYSIVDNLISNAFKYTKDGCVMVNVSLKEKEMGKYVEIVVKDTGIGLSEEEQKHIFEYFYQGKNMTIAMGMGIGLALVDNFVKICQGYINLQSKKGEGSCFTVGIPCFLKPENKSVSVNVAENMVYDDKLMLIVDDNRDMCEYVKSCFCNEFRVQMALNGEDAYEIIIRDLPDIIISDIMMNGMDDGIELCRKIKNNEMTSHIPVILLTAKSSIYDKKKGYEVGVDSYMTKPFTCDLLVTRVHNILRSRKKMTDYISKILLNTKSSEDKKKVNEIMQNKLIQNLTALIEENIKEDGLNVKFLSQKLCLSHSNLFRKVKALTGLSINEFIKVIRMKKAKVFLLTGDYSISEVSYLVGINSLRYFRECFKETYGMTPTDFLKSNK